MEIGRNEVCRCGSGRKFKACCGAPRAGGDCAMQQIMVTASGAPPGSGQRGRRVEGEGHYDAFGALREALQDPAADVGAALLRLADGFDLGAEGTLDALFATLYHGHGDEVVELLDHVLPRRRAALKQMTLGDVYLRSTGADLLLAKQALAGEPAAVRPFLAAVARFTPMMNEGVTWTFDVHLRLPESALDRKRYRYDREGGDLVAHLVALARRFAHLLCEQWGWSTARALLARREIEGLLLSRLDPGYDLAERHACADCASQQPARVDLGRGATALALDVNAIILTWPQRLAAPGGPFLCAALLEALPMWAQFLEALRLVEGKQAAQTQKMLGHAWRLLGPSVAVGTGDRALAAAARRLAQGRPAAS